MASTRMYGDTARPMPPDGLRVVTASLDRSKRKSADPHVSDRRTDTSSSSNVFQQDILEAASAQHGSDNATLTRRGSETTLHTRQVDLSNYFPSNASSLSLTSLASSLLTGASQLRTALDNNNSDDGSDTQQTLPASSISSTSGPSTSTFSPPSPPPEQNSPNPTPPALPNITSSGQTNSSSNSAPDQYPGFNSSTAHTAPRPSQPIFPIQITQQQSQSGSPFRS